MWPLLALSTLMLAVGWYLFVAASNPGYGLVALGLLAPALAAGWAITTVMVRAERPTYPLAAIALTGFGLRLLGAWVRADRAVDAVEYHRIGRELAVQFRRLQFGVDTGRDIPGTGTLRYVAGLVQVVVFDDYLASFFVFTVLAFIGTCAFHRALHVGFPEADHQRYALLVFLLPTLFFWPSSMGKEAWMLMGLGIAALGVAHLYQDRPGRGAAYLILGLTVATLVRPHVAILVLAALGVGFLARRSARSKARAAGRLLGVLVLLIGGAVLSGATADRLGIDALGTEEVAVAREDTVEKTTQGGSSFDPIVANSPITYPLAFVTVLFRPLPGEVGGIDGILPGIESIVVLGIFVASWRRFRGFFAMLRTNSYATFSLAFLLGFVWAFSAIGNFGILVRQRSQVLPFLLVFAALPVPSGPEPRVRLTGGSRTTARAGSEITDGSEAASEPVREPDEPLTAGRPRRRTP